MRAKELYEHVTINTHARWLNPSANATMCVAAARKTGLPLVMFRVDRDGLGTFAPCHAAVLLPTGRWIDVEGEHRRSETPVPCDKDCDGYDVEIVPASEIDLDENFAVQFDSIWEADVYMKFHPELRGIIEQYGGNFSYHFDE